jgi:hypothetical protein
MSWVITGREAGSLGLLDQYAGAAAAYSLRSLTLYYTGPVVRVRRSSDNTEQDFTAAQVTDGTLTTFCGAGNGFVRTWYDQSGNGIHLQQSTNDSQLTIVSGGSVVTDGGKPAIQSPTGNPNLTASWSAVPSYPKLFSVWKHTGSYLFNLTGIWHDIGTSVITSVANTTEYYEDFFHNSRPRYGTAGRALNTRYIQSNEYTAGTNTVRLNSSTIGTNTYTLTTPTTLRVGSQGDYPATGFIQELIIYTNGTGVDRSAVVTALNSYYSVF